LSSVSPERCDVITPQPLRFASLTASIDSVTEPIWFTLSSRQLHAFFSAAVLMRSTFVTVRSSPTTWQPSPTLAVKLTQPSQSSWSNGSSIVAIGKSLMSCEYMSASWAAVILFSGTFSASGVHVSRSYSSLPSVLNSELATSRPTVHLPSYPAALIASITSSQPERLSHGGAKPPSSPMSVASPPNFFLITFLRLWYTSVPMTIASLKSFAPVGITKYSWNASLLPAWLPPLITLKHGVGSVNGVSVLPARSA